MIEGEGPYILWQDFGYEGWRGQRFKTLKEALMAERYQSDWMITRDINWEPVEQPDE